MKEIVMRLNTDGKYIDESGKLTSPISTTVNQWSNNSTKYRFILDSSFAQKTVQVIIKRKDNERAIYTLEKVDGGYDWYVPLYATEVEGPVAAVIVVSSEDYSLQCDGFTINIKHSNKPSDIGPAPQPTDIVDLQNRMATVESLIPDAASEDNQVVTESDLALKLDKVEEETTYTQTYAKTSDGEQTMLDTTEQVVTEAVVQRNNAGQVIVPTTPTNAAHATAKVYVDNGLALKADADDTYTKQQVDSKIEEASSKFYGSFNTKAALDAATLVTTPTKNDYAIVISDETHEGSTTQYGWVTNTTPARWNYQYVVSTSPLSDAQLAAINSGITSTKVGNYEELLTFVKSGTSSSNKLVNDSDIASFITKDVNDLTNYYGKSVLYTKTEADLLLGQKADSDDVYTKTEITTNYYTKQDTDTLLSSKADSDDVYEKTETYSSGEIDSALSVKANANDVYTKTLTYSKDEVDLALQGKASQSEFTTLSGQVALKANSSDVYTKSQVYTKTETDGLLDDKVDLTAIDKVVLTNSTIEQVGTQSVPSDVVNVKHGTINIKTGVTNTETDVFPLATSYAAGLMSPSDVSAIGSLNTRVGNLEAGQVLLTYTSTSEPTATQINAYAVSQGYSAPFAGVVVIANYNNHRWQYFANTQTWNDMGGPIVETFTNQSLGLIKGSATGDGKVYAENDGTGSVIGFDSVKNRISNLETAIATKQEQSDNTLTTTSKSVVGAINELETDVTNLGTNKANASDVYTKSETYTKTEIGGLLDDKVDISTYESVASQVSTNTNDISALGTNKQDKNDNSLATTAKTIVGAINENKTNIALKQSATDNSLSTTAKTVTGAINELKTSVDGKQSALPTVVNNRYLHTNSTTGALEWSEVVAGVQDVKVNGTSILSSGVANIPLGSANDFGVVKVDGSTILANNGVVSVNETTIATKSDLQSKQDNVVFNTAYNASSNKAATMADIANAITSAINANY